MIDPDADEELDEDDGEDLGRPIDLRPLEAHRIEPRFLRNLRIRIERRQLSADFARLFWSLPGTILRGMLTGMAPRSDTPDSAPENPEEDPHG